MRHMITTKKINVLAGVIAMMVAGLLLVGCDDSKPVETPKKTNHYETGRFALQYMIPVARLWSPDAQPVTLYVQPSYGQHRPGRQVRQLARGLWFAFAEKSGAFHVVRHGGLQDQG